MTGPGRRGPNSPKAPSPSTGEAVGAAGSGPTGGTDPDAYALSVNIARRFLSKGQQAIIAARAGVCGKQQREIAADVGVSRPRLAYALTVLD